MQINKITVSVIISITTTFNEMQLEAYTLWYYIKKVIIKMFICISVSADLWNWNG